MKRGGAIKRKAKRRTPEQVAESLLWHREVMAQSETLYTAYEPDHPAIQAHHLIPRQVCRRHGAPSWDSRNGVRVSGRRHTRHHAAIEPIRWTELSSQRRYFVQMFAVEHGLEGWLERHVPGYSR